MNQTGTENVPCSTGLLPLSINIITCEQDANYLQDCINSLPKFCEVVIVKTVCSDDKKVVTFDGEITLNDRHIKEFTWYYKLFDFSQARNIALRNSTRDWVMWIDTDDRLILNDYEYYKELDNVPLGVGGFMCGLVGFTKPYLEHEGGNGFAPQVRLFRRHDAIKWNGIVHEQILDSILEQKYQVKQSPILVQHIGYDVDVNAMYAKIKRNVQLLTRQCAVYPDYATRYYQQSLANSIIELHKLEDNKNGIST